MSPFPKDKKVVVRQTKPEAKVASEKPERIETLEMDEAIKMLRTTRATFYRWLRSGQVKGMKVGRQWRFQRSDLLAFMKGEEPKIELRVGVGPLLRELAAHLSEPPNTDDLPNPTIADVAKLMLELALHIKATDVHIAPHSPSLSESPQCLFRYRINGLLQTMATADMRLLAPLVEYWKLQAGCNRTEGNLTPEGHYHGSVNGHDVSCRLTFLPSSRGECLSLQILHQVDQVTYENLERFIPGEIARQKLTDTISGSWGLVLIAGPTGSGKTSTLYACMAQVASQEKEIVAIDDQTSVPIPWVTQLALGGPKGIGVNEALRMAVRFGPDALVIGEIREPETIRLSLEAAKTGHLVFTAVHASDAVNALQQQHFLSGDAFLVSESLRLVLAQKLLRKVCPNCAETSEPSEFHVALIRKMVNEHGFTWDAKSCAHAKGCPRCSGTGYVGRTVIQEVLTMTPRMALALQTKAQRQELLRLAIEEGMVSMTREAMSLVDAGKTTLAEVISVLGGSAN